MRAISYLLLALALAACAPGAADTVPQNVMTVTITSDGQIVIDGAPTAVADLDTTFRAAAEAQKSVWYYREGSEREPTPQASRASDAVMRAVIESQLPISLSTRPDFSNYVDDQGVVRERQ